MPSANADGQRVELTVTQQTVETLLAFHALLVKLAPPIRSVGRDKILRFGPSYGSRLVDFDAQ